MKTAINSTISKNYLYLYSLSKRHCIYNYNFKHLLLIVAILKRVNLYYNRSAVLFLCILDHTTILEPLRGKREI